MSEPQVMTQVYHGSSGIHHFLVQCPAVPSIFQQVPDMPSSCQQYPTFSSIYAMCWVIGPADSSKCPTYNICWVKAQQYPAFSSKCPTCPAIASSTRRRDYVGIWLNPNIFQHAMLGHRSSGFQQYPTYNICWVKAQQYPTFSSKCLTCTNCWVHAQQLPAVPDVGIMSGFG